MPVLRKVALVSMLLSLAHVVFPGVLLAKSAKPVPLRSPLPIGAPQLRYGSLQHLTFTAKSGLHAKFVSPLDGSPSMLEATEVSIATGRGAGIELRVNGVLVSNRHLGERSVFSKTGTTIYHYYGVPLHPGPNDLTAIPLGAAGLRGDIVHELVYGPGAPESIIVQPEGRPVADGHTPITLRIFALDRWHHPAAPGSRVVVTIRSGDVRILDRSRRRRPRRRLPGQALTPRAPASPNNGSKRYEGTIGQEGNAYIHLLPGIVPGRVSVAVRVASIDELAEFYLAPMLRHAFVNGIAQLGAGSVPGTVDGSAIADNGGSRRQRLGIYASGTVGRDSLLTFAYESQNRLAPLSSLGPYTQDPNERPYLTYGDSSSLYSPLLSADHLYMRLDRGLSSLLWGRYDATIGSSEVGAFHQLLSGARADLALGRTGSVRLRGFTAKNQEAFVSMTVPAAGLATLQRNLNPNIVVGSDYLQLIALDRQTGAVLSETPLIRNVDYTIDYATGVLRFINIPLPYDANFDPQEISISYQYSGPGVNSQSTGGDISIAMGRRRNTKLSLGYVNDATGTQNFGLSSQSLLHTWRNGSWSISHATSAGAVPTAVSLAVLGSTGSAFAFSAHIHGRNDTLDLSSAATSAGYQDPFGGVSTPGLSTYRLSATHHLGEHSSLLLAYSGAASRTATSPNSFSDALFEWIDSPLKKLSFLVGIDRHQQHVGIAAPNVGPSSAPTTVLPAALTQTQAQVGLTYRPTKRLTAMFQQYLTLAGSDVGSTQPTQTQIELDYAIASKTRIFARMLRSSQPSATIGNAATGSAYGVPSTRSYQFGFLQSLSPTTTISQSYNIMQVGNAMNLYSESGVQQRFRFGKHWIGNAFLQNAGAVSSTLGGFSVYGTQLGYTDGRRFRSSFSLQNRTGLGGGATFALALAGRVTSTISAVGTLQRAFSANAMEIQDRLSIARRSLSNDRFITLVNYTRTNATGLTDGINDVISSEELWRVSERDQLAGRYAYKLSGDSFFAAHTSMFAVRYSHRFHGAFDLAGSAREFLVPAVPGADSTTLAAELGYSIGDSARVAVGYTFIGASDPTMTAAPTRRGLYITMTTLVNRIFGWGKE